MADDNRGLWFAIRNDHKSVWIEGLDGMDIESTTNELELGPLADVVEAFSQWLGSIDADEAEARRQQPPNRPSSTVAVFDPE